MIRMFGPVRLSGFCAALRLSADQALAWGATGHRLIGREAVLALPAELPSFVRTQGAAEVVGGLAREPDSWKAGYLPYSIIDGWQQLAKDFGYWRVDAAAAAKVADPAHRAWCAADRA